MIVTLQKLDYFDKHNHGFNRGPDQRNVCKCAICNETAHAKRPGAEVVLEFSSSLPSISSQTNGGAGGG